MFKAPDVVATAISPAAMMPVVVEILISAAILAGMLGNMRTWLDHSHCEPAGFETESRKSGMVLIRVEFRAGSDAEAFRRAFDPGSSGIGSLRRATGGCAA
jgi:hypothetical protein